MTGQNMTYPYPPPAAAPVAVPPRRRFSKWWPLSFFIAAVIFFIIGGGLFGGWSASAVNSCLNSYSSSSYSSRSPKGSKSSGSSGSSSSSSSYNSDTYKCAWGGGRNQALFYGAVACLALGGICKLIFWILYIVWCVKRNSSRQPTSGAYTYQPLTYSNVPAAPTAAVPAYQSAPPYPHTQSPAPARSKEQAAMTRYCSQCGAVVTTPFCPNCGVYV